MSNRTVTISPNFGRDWANQPRSRTSAVGETIRHFAPATFLSIGGAFLVYALCGPAIRMLSAGLAKLVTGGGL